MFQVNPAAVANSIYFWASSVAQLVQQPAPLVAGESNQSPLDRKILENI